MRQAPSPPSERAMPTERQKMLAGELYDPLDKELGSLRLRARALTKAYNDSAPDRPEDRKRLLRELVPGIRDGVTIEPPFYCDYGTNISIGKGTFLNFNCVVLDVAPVTIGSRVLFGPSVQVYTATHPMSARERKRGLESGKPISIGDEAWIGGGAVICPGVTIGARSVIGAGSVVTRNIPADVFAAGNPCRVIRSLVED
jgi:maltose O-acetyltransferase